MMYRLIYLTNNSEYKTFDSEDYNIIADNHLKIKRGGNKIICLVDFYYNVILNKCRDYPAHTERINDYTF